MSNTPALRVSHLSDARQLANGLNRALRRTDAFGLSADDTTVTVDRAMSVSGGALSVDLDYAITGGAFIVRPSTDAYSNVQFQEVGGTQRANLYGGTTSDTAFYVDANSIILEDLAEANVFISASAAEVDIKAGNVTKLSVKSSGVSIIGLVNAANDAAAATAGVPVNGLYRNGSVVMVRVV